MKTFTTMVMAVILSVMAVAQDYELIPPDEIKEIADRNARSLWGEVNPAEPIPYYGFDDEIVAWRINYSIGKPFPDFNTLKTACRQAQAEGNVDVRWGKKSYARMLMGARTNMAVMLEYAHMLSPEFTESAKFDRLATKAFGNGEVSVQKTYYLGQFNIWFEVTDGTEVKYIGVSPTGGILSQQEFAELKGSKRMFCKSGDFTKDWETYKSGFVDGTKSDVYVPYYELMPFIDWSYGCSPTSAMMVLAYYDNRSFVSEHKYPLFTNNVFERPDDVQEDYDYTVWGTHKQLAVQMDTDTSTGGTYVYNIDNGIQRVANNSLGYNFDCYNRYTTPWTRLKGEIDAGRPLPHTSYNADHTYAAVGYNNATDKIIVHNTWEPGLSWVDKTHVDVVHVVKPGGGWGHAIELIHPRGDMRYNKTGQGEVFNAGDVDEIRWRTDCYGEGMVRIFLSTNGGRSWEDIATTENDHYYDWSIPSGISSDACRIMVWLTMDTDSQEVVGGDASLSNFSIDPGGSLPMMNSGTLYTTDDMSRYFLFQHTDPSWAIIGNKSVDPDCHWETQLMPDENFNQPALVSSITGYPSNFIVIDGNHAPGTVHGVKAQPGIMDTTNHIQYEGGNDVLSVTPGAALQVMWNENKLVKMYDIHLTPGNYFFKCTRGSGDIDIDMAFFSSGDGDYYKTILQADYISENYGWSEDSFIVDVTEEDDYGLCLFAKTRGTGHVNLKVDNAFVWTGDEDSNWHNPDNWSGGTVPGWENDVAIPNTSNDPNIYTAAAHCNSLNIMSSAKVRLTSYDLELAGDLLINGELETMNSSMQVFCQGDVTVMDDAIFDLADGSQLWVYGDWTFEEGSYVHMNSGTIKFSGTENSIIYVKSENSYFNNLRISKTGGAWVAYDNCPGLRPLVIQNQFIIDDGAKFIQWAMYNSVFNGPFLVYGTGTFSFTSGSAIFDYSGSGGIAVNCTDGSYFNDMVVSCADWLQLSNDINIHGDLTIQEGNFKTMGYDVYIKGDWNDEAWGFNHGSSRVIFCGSGTQESWGGAFWELEVDKPGGELRIRENTTGIQHYDWTQGTVRVNGGYFFVADLDDPGLYGDIILTEGNIEIHQDPGQYLDMNANLEITGGEMELYGGNGIGYWPYSANASITMSDGLLNIHDFGIRIYNSVSYDLEENITGGTIMINGDLRISRNDFNPEGGTIMLYGYEEDAVLSSVESASLFNFVLDKSSKDKALAANLTASGVVDINGDFTIDGGNFEAPTVMKVYGQFINNLNPDNFDAMEGTLIFDGPGDNSIQEDETFYNLTIQKPSDYFIVDEGVAIDIENTLTVEEGIVGFLAGCDLSLGEALAVNSGGTLVFEGSELERINVNSAVGKGNYAFDINGGGTIGAINTTFIYMDTEGLNLHSGCYVMPEGAFHNCTFAYGLPGGTLLTIDNGADLVIHDANFLPNTTGMAYNVVKNVDNGNVQFDGATGDFSGEDYENDPYNRIHWEYIPPFDLPFTEKWDSGDFEANLWTTTGANWVIDDLYGSSAPSAAFRYTPTITGYSKQLRSYQLNAESIDWIKLSYEIAYDEYQPGTLEQLSVHVLYPNGDYYTIANYTNGSGSFDFISEEIDISEYAAGEIFQISFVAHGENTWNINKWNIDNILVEEFLPVPGTLKGIVSGSDEKGGIDGALVQILNTQFETYTNSEGVYVFEDVPPAEYMIQVSAGGYQIENKGVEVISGITLVMNFELTPLPPQYCSDNLYQTGCTEGDGINTFMLEDIVNEDSGCSDGGYGDFTAMSTNMGIGGVYPLFVSSNYSNQNVSIWIDLNDDLMFSPEEMFVEDFLMATANDMAEIPFEIPDTLYPGEHRLRIRTNWNASSADPCATFNYGETEDYTVNLVDEPALSGLAIFVSDSLSKAPIENAYIEVVGTNWHGYTEEEGYCFINGVESGIYDVQVLAEGFEELILPNQNLYAGHTLSIECMMAPVLPKTQTIYLKEGWQGLSGWLMPQNNNIQDIFAPVANYLVIVHDDERVYWPEGQLFTLNYWKHHDAFIVKMNGDIELELTGFAESELSCPVDAGWSMLPVICPVDVSLNDLLSGTTALENLVLIKEIAGMGVFWPEYGIHSLEVLESGSAYRILMENEDNVIFPESPEKMLSTTPLWNYPQLPDCNIPHKSAASHVVAFTPGCFDGMIAKDAWIAAVNTEGICCGMAPLESNTSITIFGDDPTTFDKDGFTVGEELEFALINPETLEEQDLLVQFDPSLPQSDGRFTNDGISLVNSIELKPDNIFSPDISNVSVYPNPTTGIITIVGLPEKCEVQIISSGGQLMRKSAILQEHNKIDLSGYEKGVYLVKIQSNSSTITKRIIRL